MAAALGITEAAVRSRVYSDPELKALYAHRKGSFGKPADVSPEPPDKLVQFKRGQDDLPEVVRGVEIAESISDLDRDAYYSALLDYGVSEAQIKKLRSLDGLAKDSGRRMAASLQISHQNFIGQMHKLAEVRDEVQERMKSATTIEEYTMLAKCLVECTKEARQGHETIMEGTQAMVRMIAVASGVSDTAPARETKWKPKKVNPAKD